MARRAFKHQSNDRRFALFFVKAAALLAIDAAPYLISSASRFSDCRRLKT